MGKMFRRLSHSTYDEHADRGDEGEDEMSDNAFDEDE